MLTSRFDHDWENDESTLKATLSICYSWEKPYPARTQCDPDDGWEAGGGLDEWGIEDAKITAVNGGDVGTPCGSPQADAFDAILVESAKYCITALINSPKSPEGALFYEQIENAIADDIARQSLGVEA